MLKVAEHKGMRARAPKAPTLLVMPLKPMYGLLLLKYLSLEIQENVMEWCFTPIFPSQWCAALSGLIMNMVHYSTFFTYIRYRQMKIIIIEVTVLRMLTFYLIVQIGLCRSARQLQSALLMLGAHAHESCCSQFVCLSVSVCVCVLSI